MAVFASAGLLAGAFLFASMASAQRTAESTAAAQSKAMAEGRNHLLYDVSKEVSVQGTVVSYTEHPETPPIGARVLIQTAPSNTVDVLLGDVRLLKQNNFAISTGSNIRVVGETMSVSRQQVFVARIVQQGAQAVALRSASGAPIVFTGNRGKTSTPSSTQGGPR